MIEQLKQHLEHELCADDSKYTLPAVRDFIRKCDQHFVVKRTNVIIHYVYPTGEMNVPLILIKKVATRIDIILEKFGFKCEGKPLEYFLLPLDAPRKFPRKHEEFGPQHINGAFTYRTNRRIYLYRAEEFPKVALHEACHHLPFHTEDWDDGALARLHDVFKIDKSGCPYNCKTNILPNEAVIEFWAEVMHLCFLNAEYGVPVSELLKKEMEHGIVKTAQVLQHQRRSFPEWKESTHAYSYVVLRTILLAFCDEFMSIPYPYDSRRVSEFMITKFHSPQFEAAIKDAGSAGADMRMTLFGDF